MYIWSAHFVLLLLLLHFKTTSQAASNQTKPMQSDFRIIKSSIQIDQRHFMINQWPASNKMPHLKHVRGDVFSVFLVVLTSLFSHSTLSYVFADFQTNRIQYLACSHKIFVKMHFFCFIQMELNIRMEWIDGVSSIFYTKKII